MVKLKVSEVKIIFLLSQIYDNLKYVRFIASKLNYDYDYIAKSVRGMVLKGWIKQHQYGHKKFLILTKKAPVKEAKKLYGVQDE